MAQSGLTMFLAVSTWLTYGALLTLATITPTVTWIGVINLLGLVAWSLVLRMIDRAIFVPDDHVPSHADRPDAAVFMGRRHSALILEGSRADIARWTGSGLCLRTSSWAHWLHTLSRVGTLAFLIWVFCSVPNGSTDDQLLFFGCNVLGWMNTYIGQRLHVKHTYQKLELMEHSMQKLPTHLVVGSLHVQLDRH